MKKLVLVVIIGLAVFVVSVLVVFGVQYTIKKPPLSEISMAREKVTLANKNHCAKYAPKTYYKARQHYDSAMVHWEKENSKLVINRNYGKVKYFADRATSLAEKAISLTNKSIAEKKTALEKDVANLNSKIKYFDKNFEKFPITKGERKNLSQVKMLAHESENALKRANYIDGQEKVDKALKTITKLTKQYTEERQAYFASYNMWKKMTETAISNSKKQNSIGIVVDKYNRKCFLYKNGHLQQTYDVELGPNWIGNKQYQGDKATPEGNYKVIKKKSNGNSKYHHALLLDYPNDNDKKRFEDNKAKGRIESKSKIGNLIEIHGDGDKGMDWTDGCVALSNKNMLSLFNICSEGTPVTIVGSTRPLTEIIKEVNE